MVSTDSRLWPNFERILIVPITNIYFGILSYKNLNSSRIWILWLTKSYKNKYHVWRTGVNSPGNIGFYVSSKSLYKLIPSSYARSFAKTAFEEIFLKGLQMNQNEKTFEQACVFLEASCHSHYEHNFTYFIL